MKTETLSQRHTTHSSPPRQKVKDLESTQTNCESLYTNMFSDRQQNDGESHLRAKPCCAFLGISESTFYALQDPNSDQYDPSFPRGYRVSPRIRVWRTSELNAWIESKA